MTKAMSNVKREHRIKRTESIVDHIKRKRQQILISISVDASAVTNAENLLAVQPEPTLLGLNGDAEKRVPPHAGLAPEWENAASLARRLDRQRWESQYI
jgi:hypothetical protein